MKLLKCVACAIFLLCAAESFAQSPNSAEHHRQWNPQHAGYDGNRYSPPPPPPGELWENKFAVIAVDTTTGQVGFAESNRSLRAAQREAIRDCGGRRCEVAAAATNGCVAVVNGDSSSGFFSAAADLNGAISEAENRCRARGKQSCQVVFQHCALPVRIR